MRLTLEFQDGHEAKSVIVWTLEEFAPGVTSRVIARQVITPADLERTYGLTGGHPMHGEMSLDQMFVGRPLLGWHRYRGPLEGLGVRGGPAANAVREIVADLK